MKKIVVCIGTRPEAIKMAPLIHMLKQDSEYEVYVCSTGQHKEMVDEIFKFFEIEPNVDFQLMGKTKNILDLSSKLIGKFDTYLDEVKPDLVLAQGDTTSVFVAAVAAYYKRIKFGHVEAGLRTYNKYSPWPEEGNRKMVSPVTDFHFAPTLRSKLNLINEGIPLEDIFVTGNTVIDALLMTLDIIGDSEPRIDFGQDIEQYEKIILITGHRRENIGIGFDNIFSAIEQLARAYPKVAFIFPVHLNPEVRSQVDSLLRTKELQNLMLISPLSYPEFVWLMKKSYFIITDSGGVQEEAPTLGKPVLVTRDTTERPEGVDAGVVKIVGAKKENIVQEAVLLLEDEYEYNKIAQIKNPYGDGTATKIICDTIKLHL